MTDVLLIYRPYRSQIVAAYAGIIFEIFWLVLLGGLLFTLPSGRRPYNEYCIYGEDDTADAALAVCDGCIYKIRNYVTELLQGKAKIGD